MVLGLTAVAVVCALAVLAAPALTSRPPGHRHARRPDAGTRPGRRG